MNAIIFYDRTFKTLSLFRPGLIFASCCRGGGFGLWGYPLYNLKTPHDILANKSCKDHLDPGGGGRVLPYRSQILMSRRSCPFRKRSLPFLRHLEIFDLFLSVSIKKKGVALAPVWSENGYRLFPFPSGIGYGLQLNYGSV